MKTVGVICEYNPFHKGHEYQLSQIRQSGANIIIGVMSGHFTQRGLSSFCDKYTRATMAVTAGCDIVVELPFPYCASGASFFAKAGISILARMGIDTLCFGSETGDLTYLQSISQKLHPAKKQEYGSRSFFSTLQETSDQTIAPNDLLNLSYLSWLQSKSFSSISPFLVKRIGNSYLNDTLLQNQYPSATALRKAFFDGHAIQSFIPETSFSFLQSAITKGVVQQKEFLPDALVISFLSMLNPLEYKCFAECGGGLLERLHKKALSCSSLEQLYSAVSCKHYTLSHIRRAILFAMTKVTYKDLETDPSYSTLLAINERGKNYLGSLRKQPHITILTKPSDAKNISGAGRQMELSYQSDALFVQNLMCPLPTNYFFKMKPVVLS